MLMNVAKYLNDDWQPNMCDATKNNYYIMIQDNQIMVANVSLMTCLDVYFKSRELAEKAIEILGEETIRLALCTDY